MLGIGGGGTAGSLPEGRFYPYGRIRTAGNWCRSSVSTEDYLQLPPPFCSGSEAGEQNYYRRSALREGRVILGDGPHGFSAHCFDNDNGLSLWNIRSPYSRMSLCEFTAVLHERENSEGLVLGSRWIMITGKTGFGNS